MLPHSEPEELFSSMVFCVDLDGNKPSQEQERNPPLPPKSPLSSTLHQQHQLLFPSHTNPIPNTQCCSCSHPVNTHSLASFHTLLPTQEPQMHTHLSPPLPSQSGRFLGPCIRVCLQSLL
ncbi:hypothetical protein V8G54_029820 [Vigna mungo]|uniref:Uncharacterized protein n=1 Tax=Vigna mungo TaxID=3915 RepID=A0AAQ3MVI4_VIGMU